MQAEKQVLLLRLARVISHRLDSFRPTLFVYLECVCVCCQNYF